MSRKCALSTQTNKIWLIIRKNQYITQDYIDEYLSVYADEYAYICHEHDIDENGIQEGVHYHFVYNLKEQFKRDRLSTTLNHICQVFGFDNNNGIQIEKYDSFEGCIQYLTHKNQPEKTQHNVKEIKTNIDKETFDLFYNVDLKDVFSFNFVYSSCISHTNKLQMIRDLWGWYSKNSTYKRVIDDIWELTREIHRW